MSVLHSVDAESALSRRSYNFVPMGNVEGTGLNAIPAAYAPLLVYYHRLALV